MADTATIRVRVTPALAADFASRELAAKAVADGSPNPYAAVEALAYRGGDVDLSAEQATELLADAAFYADEEGPEISVGLRSAYRLLVDRLRSAGVEPKPEPEPADEDRLGRLRRLQAEDEQALADLDGETASWATAKAESLRYVIGKRAETIARLEDEASK